MNKSQIKKERGARRRRRRQKKVVKKNKNCRIFLAGKLSRPKMEEKRRRETFFRIDDGQIVVICEGYLEKERKLFRLLNISQPFEHLKRADITAKSLFSFFLSLKRNKKKKLHVYYIAWLMPFPQMFDGSHENGWLTCSCVCVYPLFFFLCLHVQVKEKFHGSRLSV
jgi:hypothetical protein